MRNEELVALMSLIEAGGARVTGTAARTVEITAEDGKRMTVKATTVAQAAGTGLVKRQGTKLIPAAATGGSSEAGGAITQPSHGSPGFDAAESPLAHLAMRKGRNGGAFLERREVDAGERLRSDYTRGQIMPRLGASLVPAAGNGRRSGGAGGMAELTDAAMAARQRVDAAIGAVGPELAGVLIDVCCFHKGMETVEFERGWPIRSAKVVLKTALAALARHYWPRRGASRPATLHWGAQDYRPAITPAE